ncbi:hypothetical protein ACHHYP_20121 [Achlya hypogyna]|uniref:Uncharacterized protein n=1 Tax=Achlya hypogyna TaxID=1202772 RepID=A0A1V9Z453_ACHHY|nr:hypothetical protein ACHHYP_20121 [Achlya hypogyna]
MARQLCMWQLSKDTEKLCGSSWQLALIPTYGHEYVVRLILASGVDVNLPDSVSGISSFTWFLQEGRSPLWTSAFQGHKAIVRQLLDAGAVVDQANNVALPCVAWSSYHCRLARLRFSRLPKEENSKLSDSFWTRVRQWIFPLLYTAKKVVVAHRSWQQENVTPLYIASMGGHVEVIRMLVAAGANVHLAYNDGSTPLTMAARSNFPEAVRELIDAGATVDHACNLGATPLFVAAQNGNLEVIQTLLRAGAAVDLATNEKATPLNVASMGGHNQVLRTLLAAALNKHPGAVRLLLDAGANVNERRFSVRP